MPIHQIHPQEFHVLVDRFEIRTRCPWDKVTKEMLLKRVKTDNLHAGDTVRVMCTSHDYSTVLHFTDFMIYSRAEDIRRVDIDERTERQLNETHYRLMRITEWVSTPAAEDPVESGDAQPCVKYNLGKRTHEVLDGEGSVLASFSKENGGKDAAQAFFNEQFDTAA